MPSLKRICIHWSRFGPYHLARLQAAHDVLAGHGVEVVGLETAAKDSTYAWRVEAGRTAFRREQVFPGRVFEEISPAEMHRGITAALRRLAPDAVATISYSTPDARAADRCAWWMYVKQRYSFAE